MQFMMFVATDPEPDAQPEAAHEIGAWFEDVNGSGRWIAGDRLRPPGEAKTIRVRSGTLTVTAGPFAASTEMIVGFDILECRDLDEAVAIAAKHPMARAGRIEIRQFWPHEDI